MKTGEYYINGKAAGRVAVADSYFLRLRGLLGRSFDGFNALLLVPCSQIHTIGMGYAIDAVYIDVRGRVIRADENISPGKIRPYIKGAHSVLELPQGGAKRLGIAEGAEVRMYGCS